MVYLQNILLKAAHKSIRTHLKGKFIDSLRLTVKGGHGGNGLPKYGGAGGQGGCVYLTAKEDITLKRVLSKNSSKKIIAGHGEDSTKNRILGRRGIDINLKVPVGVTIIDDKGKVIDDLNEEGATCLAAGGGGGGCSGNLFIGHRGQTSTITLDLKLIADTGLVGFPNAGKSTLLKAISNASPKIASYPFTTIRPQIGTISYPDYRQITIADLPGLIEGAHTNIGMGHKFLKHVERTRLLIVIVDIFGFQLSQSHKRRNFLENIYALNKELELYDETLLDKPCILLINKLDLEGSVEELIKYEKSVYDLKDKLDECPEEIRPKTVMRFEDVIPISARNVKEIDKVKQSVRKVLDNEAEQKLEEIDKEAVYAKLREVGPRVN